MKYSPRHNTYLLEKDFCRGKATERKIEGKRQFFFSSKMFFDHRNVGHLGNPTVFN